MTRLMALASVVLAALALVGVAPTSSADDRRGLRFDQPQRGYAPLSTVLREHTGLSGSMSTDQAIRSNAHRAPDAPAIFESHVISGQPSRSARAT